MSSCELQHWCQRAKFIEFHFMKLYVSPHQVSFLHFFTFQCQREDTFVSISSQGKHHISSVGIFLVFSFILIFTNSLNSLSDIFIFPSSGPVDPGL